jgi:hypothetical protein
MSASTIFFNGRVISIPGSYTEVDASGLESVGLGASGYVALLGTSKGGIPYDAIDPANVPGTLQIATRAQQAFTWFREGDLREAAPLVFGPSNDADVPAGAQRIYFVKVNPAEQSSAAFDNTDGEALVLMSEDYGFHTTQVNVEIGNGTVQGKLITIVFETLSEVFDDVGGDSVFDVTYLSSTPADGFTTITLEVTASALVCAFTRDQIGLDSDVTNQVTATQVIECVSSDAGDTAVIEIYGTDTSDLTQRALVTLTGTVAVDTTETWNSFHGVRVVSGTLAGTLTLQNDSGGTVITTIAPAGTDSALEPLVDMAVANSALTYVSDAADTARVTVVGLNNAGSIQTETVLLNGVTPVAGSALWKRIDYLALGEQAAARTLTISGNAINSPFAGLDTLTKMADKFNGTPGFDFDANVQNPGTYDPDDLDIAAATDILSPANPDFYGDLMAIVNKLNSSSALVTAVRGSVGSGVPDNTTAPVYLTGGHEGNAGTPETITATANDWGNAIDLLKKVRVNTLVPLTGDPAIHALIKSHCEYMAGIGRSERDAVVGLQDAGQLTYPTKTEAKAQIIDLGSRHIRAVAQQVERYNTSGEREVFPTYYNAAVVGGMQAGSPVGTSLTHKFANALSIVQDATWNPSDDAEEMIQAGLCFMEVVDGVGIRVVRNITTWLTSSNLAYTEASVNEAANYAVYNFRETMERMVGKSGFAGTASAASGLAVNILGLLVGVALVAWRSLEIDLVLDVLEVSCEIAPVLPINFVQTTVHLVAIPQSAAAA